jgi:flagellar basal-body rod modification protein FlgD
MTFTPIPTTTNPDGSRTVQSVTSTTSSELAKQKDMFLKMLIAQLQNQDPSAPMDQKDMMSQMSQMSSVEQLGNIAQTMSSLQTNATVSQSVAMIGHKIDYLSQDGGVVHDAAVQSVALAGNSVNLVMEDGTTITPGSVVMVK